MFCLTIHAEVSTPGTSPAAEDALNPTRFNDSCPSVRSSEAHVNICEADVEKHIHTHTDTCALSAVNATHFSDASQNSPSTCHPFQHAASGLHRVTTCQKHWHIASSNWSMLSHSILQSGQGGREEAETQANVHLYYKWHPQEPTRCTHAHTHSHTRKQTHTHIHTHTSTNTNTYKYTNDGVIRHAFRHICSEVVSFPISWLSFIHIYVSKTQKKIELGRLNLLKITVQRNL